MVSQVRDLAVGNTYRRRGDSWVPAGTFTVTEIGDLHVIDGREWRVVSEYREGDSPSRVVKQPVRADAGVDILRG